MLHQVECLIYDVLLPIPISRFRVSKKLLLEKVDGGIGQDGQPKHFTVAYLGIDAPTGPKRFRVAVEYLDLFLLTHSLMSRRGPSRRFGFPTGLDDICSLGNSRNNWKHLKREGPIQGEDQYDLSASKDGKTLLESKRLFLHSLPDLDEILGGYLGLALRFHYLAGAERTWDEKLILLMIAAETLLVKGLKESGKRETLAKRMPPLIAETKRDRERISCDIGRLYKLRNDIVHEGLKKAYQRDVRILFGYLGRALRKSLSNREFRKAELVARLDEA